jgi:hypothetical protein
VDSLARSHGRIDASGRARAQQMYLTLPFGSFQSPSFAYEMPGLEDGGEHESGAFLSRHLSTANRGDL